MVPKPSSAEARTRSHADRFLDEVRRDVERAASRGDDTPPRLRSVHERPGHASPEFRTKTIQLPDGGLEDFPGYLSRVIGRYAAEKRPDRMILAVEAVQLEGPVILAEARDRDGTRLFWRQPYVLEGRQVQWGSPAGGGWQDPGEEPMILDTSFQ